MLTESILSYSVLKVFFIQSLSSRSRHPASLRCTRSALQGTYMNIIKYSVSTASPNSHPLVIALPSLPGLERLTTDSGASPVGVVVGVEASEIEPVVDEVVVEVAEVLVKVVLDDEVGTQ